MAINNVNNAGQKPQLESQRLNQQQAQQGQNANNAQQSQQAAKTANAPRQDSVSLTQSAQQLTNVQKKGSDAPVNQEKVERLKAAIQNGSYQINAEQLASKISKAESDLFGAAKS